MAKQQTDIKRSWPRLLVRVAVWVVGALAATVGGLVIVAASTGFIGRPLRYEIAESFDDGWVTFIYEKSDCKVLDEDGLFLVLSIDKGGNGCTSSQLPRGWRYNKFVHVDKGGKRSTLVSSSWASEQSRMIWADSVMPPQELVSHTTEIFFVGTSAQLKSAWSRQPAPFRNWPR